MKKKRILIIDDDIPLTQAMKINLEETGDYEVAVENNALNAIDTARSFRPDLVLLDIVMPDLDGGDVSARFRSDPLLNQVPILIVTALVSNEETGPDAVVSSGDGLMVAKPIQFEKLLRIMEEQLAKAA
ncbi:MAG: response regulator [Verrucomicrobiae bacterium]|nr:response regulator [Verrucomicrobiae bacterium]